MGRVALKAGREAIRLFKKFTGSALRHLPKWLTDVLERNYSGFPARMPYVVNKEAFTETDFEI
jgi:hypothetical protein